jgi:hypothetical protein
MTGFLFGLALVVAAVQNGSAIGSARQRQLENWWAELGSADQAKACQAASALVAQGATTVSLLEKRLRPVAVPDAGHLARLIKDLDSNRYGDRQKATQEIESFGELAEPLLIKTLANRPSLEVSRRIERILAENKINRLYPPAERRRQARAIEVLEQIGNTEARKLLSSLAKGAPDAALTRDARGALDRLSRQTATRRRRDIAIRNAIHSEKERMLSCDALHL